MQLVKETPPLRQPQQPTLLVVVEVLDGDGFQRVEVGPAPRTKAI